jgi:hypothetical protein
MSRFGSISQTKLAQWNNTSAGYTDLTSRPNHDVSIGSGIPEDVPIRIYYRSYDPYTESFLPYTSTDSDGGNFEQVTYIDEGMDVYVFGNISWYRLNATTIRFCYFMDYSNVQNAWAPFIDGIGAYY